MKILITGGAGFIGSHLSELLIKEGHTVCALDNLSTGELANLASVQDSPNFSFIEADGTNYPELDSLIASHDTIIHLAAAVGVQKIIDEPVATLETNIDFTQRILRACVPNKTRALIASTSEVYGRSEAELFSESNDMLIGPPTSRRWGYAASKIVDEFLALAWHYEAQLPVTVLRLFNTVGPRQTGRYGMVIPRFVGRALKGETLQVYGDGEQSRTFTAVSEATKAINELITCDAAIGQVVNIGGVAQTSIMDLAKRVIHLSESKSETQLISYEEAYSDTFEDMRRRTPDTARLKGMLGWAPSSSLDQILQSVIDDMRTRMG